MQAARYRGDRALDYKVGDQDGPVEEECEA